MRRILIIGSSKCARVVAYNILAQGIYKIAGFVTTESTSEKSFMEFPLLGSYENFSVNATQKLKDMFNTTFFFIGFGSMKNRKLVYNFFTSQGWESPNIIHPSAIVSPESLIGKGVLIEAGCLVTPNPIIGNNVVINTGSQINHDNIIHDHVYIASGVVSSGSIEIGENTLIDDGVIITLGRKIGSNCIIGAGSVVTKDVPSNVVAYGNPCKIIRENSFE